MSSFSISSISTMILSLLQLLELISRTRALGSRRRERAMSPECRLDDLTEQVRRPRLTGTMS